MHRKPALKHFGNKLPPELIDAFDDAAARLGVQKQRALAAAVHAFLKLSRSEQRQACDAAFDRWYAGENVEK